MRIRFLLITAVIACASGVACSRDMRVKTQQIQIHSSWWGWGSEKTDVVIRREADGRYLRGNDVIPDRLVNDLLGAMREPLLHAPELGNLGITQAWLHANAASALRDASGPHPVPGRAETAEFRRLFQDPAQMRKIAADMFCDWHTDDYPAVTVAVLFENGSTLTAISNSQSLFMLPWGKDAAHRTYNADISRAAAALLPGKATNQERLAGKGLAGQLGFELLYEMVNTRTRFSCGT